MAAGHDDRDDFGHARYPFGDLIKSILQKTASVIRRPDPKIADRT
jgi:hypothetical protein